MKKALMLLSVFLIMGSFSNAFAECEECAEVLKGKIPVKYLEKFVKELPSGIAIWEVKEWSWMK